MNRVITIQEVSIYFICFKQDYSKVRKMCEELPPMIMVSIDVVSTPIESKYNQKMLKEFYKKDKNYLE